MSAARYFILGQVAGAPFTRYATLDGPHLVTEITISRPDGIEVPRPAHFRTRIAPYFGGEVARRWFNNVPPRHAEAARKRAGEKGARALAERRTLMLTTSDEKLAAARQRGKFRRVAA